MKTNQRSLVFFFWGVAIIFHLGALSLTWIGLQLGFEELNPIMAFFFEYGLLPAFLMSLLSYLVIAKLLWHKPIVLASLMPCLIFGFDFFNDFFVMVV